MRNKRFPKYPDDVDYTTNSSSYYDDLARKQKLIQLLAEKIWDYDERLDKRLEDLENVLQDYLAQWDERIENLDDEVSHIFVTWLEDGTLEQIINHDVLGNKADKSYVDELQDVTNYHLTSISTHISQFPRLEGETTDSPRIIRAIDHASSSGASNILFNDETYLISDVINMKNDISLTGVKGTVFKIDDDYNGFYSVLSIKNVKNVTIEGITFDGNYERTNYDISKRPEIPLYIANSQQIRIFDNTIYSVGTWAISCEVSPDLPYNDDIYIERNTVYARLGKNTEFVEPNEFSHDTTQFYIDAKNYWVRDNIISTNDTNMETAIEAHRQVGIVEGNIINGFRQGVLIVPSQFNEVNELTKIKIINNTFTDVLNGVTLWQLPERDIDGVHIMGNHIELNPNRFTLPAGSRGITILYTLPRDNNQKKILNIVIDSNIIIFKPFLTVFNDSDNVMNFAGIAMRSWVSVENISITNNQIINAPATAIIAGVSDSDVYNNTGKGFIITDNIIVNAGINEYIKTERYNPRSAIRLNGGNINLVEKSVVSNNVIIDNKSEGTYFTEPMYIDKIDKLTVYVEGNKILANGYDKILTKEKTYIPNITWDSMIGKPTIKSEGRYFENDGVTKVFGQVEITDINDFTQGYGSVVTLPKPARKTLNVPIVVVNHAFASKTDSFFLRVQEGTNKADVMYVNNDGSLGSLSKAGVKKGTIVSFNIEYLS